MNADRRAALLLAALCVGSCARRTRGSFAQLLASGASASATPLDAPRPDPTWEPVASPPLPLPLFQVRALDEGRVLLVAGSGPHAQLVAYDGAHATPVCEPLAGVPRVAATDGARFVVVGTSALRTAAGNVHANTAQQLVVWSSSDGGRTCTRTETPGAADNSADDLRVSLHGRVAYTWARGGLVLRSSDGGARWARLAGLSDVRAVAPGQNDQTVAVAYTSRYLRSPQTDRADEASALFQLAEPRATRWTPLEGHLRPNGAVALQPQPDGSTLVFDGAGRSRVRPNGLVERVRDDAGMRSHRDAPLPLLVAPATGGRFVFGTEANVLWSDDDERAAPFTSVPERPVSLDVSPDGVVWATTGTRLLRTALRGGAVETVAEWPVTALTSFLMSVQGAHIAVATTNRTIQRSADGGQHWSTLALPENAGDLRSLAVGSRGETLALFGSGLYVHDGTGFSRSALPAGFGPAGRYLEVHVAGSRWIVTGAGVATSDDLGAHWRLRLATPSGWSESTEGRGPAITETVKALARAGSTLYVLDNGLALYRSLDTGSTFSLLASPTTMGFTREVIDSMAGNVFLATDGGARIAVLARNAIGRSSDGGVSWQQHSTRMGSSPARMLYGGSGLLLLRAESICGAGSGDTRALSRELVDDLTGAVTFIASRADCAHEGRISSVDGPWLYVLRSTGGVERVRIAQL